MKPSVSASLQEVARRLQLEIRGSPFHSAEGVEVRKSFSHNDTIICVGYYLGPESVTIYRMVLSKRDEFYRNSLWFLWNWLIKAIAKDIQYEVLASVVSSKFNEELFLEYIKREFGHE